MNLDVRTICTQLGLDLERAEAAMSDTEESAQNDNDEEVIQ